MWREDDPPARADDPHIYEDDYNANAGDDNTNLTITIEELLSFLDEAPPNNGSFSHTKLHKDSIENTFAPERGKSEVSGLEKESRDAPLFHSGDHGFLQCIPINYLDISQDEQGTMPGHSFDVPGTSGNLTHICSPTCESDNFDSPVDDLCLSNEVYDTSSHRIDFPSSDFVTREQVSAPCHFVLEDASHHSELANSESNTVKDSGQQVGLAGDNSLKMAFGSAREMMLPLSPDMPKHGKSDKIMAPKVPELDIMLNKKVGVDSFYRELDEESPNLGGNLCMSSSVETSSNYITSGCSTGDSSSGVFCEDTTMHCSSQCLQHHSFPSRSVEAPVFHRDDVSDVEPCYSGRLCIENQANLVSPGKNFSNHPCDMPFLNMNSMSHDVNYHEDVNFKHPFSIKSSTFLTNCIIPSSDFHGCVTVATKYGSGFKQVAPCTQSMDQLESGLPSSQCKSSINEATLLNIPLDVDDAEVGVFDSVDSLINRPLPVPVKSCVVIPGAECSDTIYPKEPASRPKTHDEMLTFRIALQGLSQPTSESTPPDGVLSVPLLRHQRIALSWMVQKETASINCSGGILADDQGLGKTVSTIALILAERSPLTKNCGRDAKIVKVETLSLDDDDEEGAELNGISEPLVFDLTTREKTRGRDSGFTSVKGRPAAGTLVVCPTSVLRQWAEELQNKVTRKGNLSFLVYHGSNRTKDPNELSKYDVVLTTYSIVSMEFPNLPSSGNNDEEKGKVSHPVSSAKKRKISTTTKARTITDYTLLESTARPLARVAWFRVILDEAQTIKNHRTQVARACCCLRAKRRWCLSGTPIQNAIDDLYSYFRFLRYDPYAVYTSFCSKIKTPISKNPTTGYKKLQAVLKTIMLRRTKGTCIDGQPIIELPPKSITLTKVEFSQEERSFYSNLEAESREQFKIYAEAGTVKQNYVNILLMLLRLRQACDHPHLVRGYDSNSVWKASLENAKKLPKDKRMHLLNCLEACLAICTICNDPPENAVVTICGHVFCNQCICGQLAGDDNQCPSPHCKLKLDVASVFPKDLLKSSVVDTPGNCTPDASCYELSTEPPSVDCADSSKIRAAIEILQSLPRLNDCSFFTDSDVDTSKVTHNKQNPCLVNGCNGHMTEKAIVFSQWTRMLDLLEVHLKSSSLQYRRVDGTMHIAARDRAIKDFNTLPEVTVMIMSLKAASLGLNLVSASHVLLLDLWWNPTTEDQAIDRAHRIGQTRPVIVSRLTVRDTIEDRILALQEKKREMVASAFGEDKRGGRQTRLTVEDLRYLFMV